MAKCICWRIENLNREKVNSIGILTVFKSKCNQIWKPGIDKYTVLERLNKGAHLNEMVRNFGAFGTDLL